IERPEMNPAGRPCGRCVQRELHILKRLGNARSISLELADEESSVRSESGVETDAVHSAVAVIVEASMNAGSKSGEPALERRAILFKAPQPDAHRQDARLVRHLVSKEDDIAVATRDKALDATIVQPPVLERIRP